MKTMNLQTIGRELKNTRNLVAIAAFVLGMTACTQDNEPVVPAAPHTAVNILAGVTGIQSRAYADGVDDITNTFKENAVIKVINKNAVDETANYTFAVNKWTATSPLYWDNLTANVSKKYELIGIYPSTATLEYTMDDDEVMMAFSNEIEPKAEAVALGFKHILSKLTVKISLEVGFPIDLLNITAPKITLSDISKAATFKHTHTNGFADFDLSTTKESVEVSATKEADKITYTFMLPAQKITGLNFSATGLPLTYSYKAQGEGIALGQGENTTLNLTLKKTALVPSSITITGWEAGADQTGDLI